MYDMYLDKYCKQITQILLLSINKYTFVLTVFRSVPLLSICLIYSQSNSSSLTLLDDNDTAENTHSAAASALSSYQSGTSYNSGDNRTHQMVVSQGNRLKSTQTRLQRQQDDFYQLWILNTEYRPSQQPIPVYPFLIRCCRIAFADPEETSQHNIYMYKLIYFDYYFHKSFCFNFLFLFTVWTIWRKS